MTPETTRTRALWEALRHYEDDDGITRVPTDELHRILRAASRASPEEGRAQEALREARMQRDSAEHNANAWKARYDAVTSGHTLNAAAKCPECGGPSYQPSPNHPRRWVCPACAALRSPPAPSEEPREDGERREVWRDALVRIRKMTLDRRRSREKVLADIGAVVGVTLHRTGDDVALTEPDRLAPPLEDSGARRCAEPECRRPLTEGWDSVWCLACSGWGKNLIRCSVCDKPCDDPFHYDGDAGGREHPFVFADEAPASSKEGARDLVWQDVGADRGRDEGSSQAVRDVRGQGAVQAVAVSPVSPEVEGGRAP